MKASINHDSRVSHTVLEILSPKNTNKDKQEDQSRERRKMKTLAVVLVLALAFSFGEALRCNRCIGRGCSNTVETCSGPNDVCANVIFLPPAPINYFRRCMKASDCFLMQSQPTLMTGRCCGTDLCN
ncbi:unnamed protein product [Gadus morhua 'NCC']